ncbi:MAG: PRC-barrel domain-containing protein [Candidatus Kariarchaeaceae archaeon]|jgi:sporulation protein YlmC with PRC-barrel domain
MITNTNLSNLRYKRVIDSNGNDIGTINDAVINRDTMDVRGFVIHGSKFEEMMEDLKIRSDVDPLVLIESIVQIDTNYINLNITKEELPNAMAPGEITEDEILFSKLQKIPVVSNQDQNIGIFADIFFDESGFETYSLGGQAFHKMLNVYNCSENLNYVIDKKLVTQTDSGYKINVEIQEIEKQMRLNLTNVVRDVLTEAEKDGELSEDEIKLISSIRVDVIVYQNAIVQAKADNVITKEEQDELNSIKNQILQNVIKIAEADDIITRDERALIRKLAGYMSSKKEELFWTVFETT